jgi:hypothetical protein
MSNLTPFEIRLELLKMAKELLTEEYYGKRDQLQEDWRIKVETAKLNGGAIPDHPPMPAYPAEAEIITKAQSLNGFVSNTPVDKTSKKST